MSRESNAFDARILWSDVGIWEAVFSHWHDVDDAQNRKLVGTWWNVTASQKTTIFLITMQLLSVYSKYISLKRGKN